MSMRREVVMRMGTEAMMLLAAFSIGIDVDHRTPQVRQVVEQLVAHLARDVVSLRNG